MAMIIEKDAQICECGAVTCPKRKTPQAILILALHIYIQHFIFAILPQGLVMLSIVYLLYNLHFPIFCLSLSDPYFVPILCQTLQQILATNLLSMDLLECAIGGNPSFLSNSCQAMAKTSNQQLTYLVCLICYKSGCFHRTSALQATLSLTQSWHSNYPAIR